MRRSLTARLVVVTVALVLAVSVLVAVLTAVALRSYLGDRLDRDVQRTAQRGPGAGIGVAGGIDGGGPQPEPGQGGQSPLPADLSPSDIIFQGRNQEPGTLVAVLGAGVDRAVVLGEGFGEQTTVDLATATVLASVPTDGEVHQIDVPGQGSYRVIAQRITLPDDSGDGSGGDGVLISGLPTAEVNDTVRSLVQWEVVFVVVGLVAATGIGLLVVRRQLRSLREVAATAHEVAALPLDSGEIDIASRVPERLTDERTEVGAVGAALNTLLEHVESSLAARHRSEQHVRQFVADASHELRTPLTTIRGYADLATQRPETMPTAIAKVQEESGRMTALVEDLLQLARLDSGRPLAREPVDLTRLLVDAVSDARVVDPERHWKLAAPEEPIRVEGDENALHQVVTNLLANARKHTPAGTTVTVTVTPLGFTVHDDGPGFPPELVGSAFERFTRGDTSRHRSGSEGGAGLGLALVQAIVAAHGGAVTLASTPGDTTFTVTLGDGAA